MSESIAGPSCAHDAIQVTSSSYNQEEGCDTVSTTQALSVSTAQSPALLSNDPVKREAKWQSLLKVQREIEEESLARGAERFRRRVEQAETAGKGSTIGAAKRLLTHGIIPTADAITSFLQKKPTRGQRHSATKWIELVGADVAAYMAVRIVLDHIGQRPSVKDVALKITEILLDELRYRRFENEAPGLFKYKLNSFNTSSYVHMARSMNAAMRFAEVDVSDLNMPITQRVLLGTKLIDFVMQATGLITIETNTKVVARKKKGGVKRELLIVPTPATLEFLNKRNEILEFLSPVLMPMVVPPAQWEPGQKGGYRFALRYKTTLVRGDTSSKINENREMPLVYQALNAIQNTPWVINKHVFALLEVLTEKQIALAGLPTAARDALPPRPHDIDTNEVARKDWRRKAHAVKERNHLADNRALEFSRVMSTAERVKDYDAIFFPHNLDFRGRIYPVSHFLTPQGDDLQKGLLMFAQGKPLGSDGATYLALHGMNCLDTTPEGQKVKRMTLDERVRYIVDHSAEICAVANDPLGYRWWSDAEEPLQFYAFCIEWNGFMQLAKEGRGSEYVCALPVSIDGTCNGLQHFSAMLKDPVGAAAVNVSPNAQPEDVYDRIAEAVKDRLERIIKHSEPESDLATMWLASGLVNRKLTKRPTMTFSYGSKPYGFQQQLIEYLKEPDVWREVKALFTQEQKDILLPACGLMSRMIWLSLQDVVVAAFRGMEWMQDTARMISKVGKPIEWTVPITGFRVRQEYFVMQQKRIFTVLAGQAICPSVVERTPEILTRKQANAVSPNMVHSLDAAALMLSVSQAITEGVEQFAAVHDSYGTLPTDMAVMWRAARQSFVHLYANYDVVADIAQQFQAQAQPGDIIPRPPNAGTLDVASVLVSDYFFC